MKNIKITKAENEYKEIYLLQKKCITPSYSLETITNDLSSDEYIYFVAKSDNVVVGFISAKIGYEDIDIIQLVVNVEYRRQRIASHLIDALKDFCIKKEINSIYLEVNEHNPAKYVYEKNGFTFLSKRKNYYKDCDALVYMWSRDEAKL